MWSDRSQQELLAKKLAKHGRRWFAFVLCRTVNTGFGLDVDRLQRETPPELFEEWRTLYDMEPWGDERADLAVGTAIAYNMAAHKIEPKPAAEYMDLLRQPEEKEQTEEDMKRAADSICRAVAENERKGRSNANH